MRKKVLVLEDEESIREIISDFIEDFGFSALPATDGRIGVQLAQEAIPDLIIHDIALPYLNDCQVLETLRKNANTQGIPFVFVTAKTERSDLHQGMTLGADDFITKPFTR